MLTENAGEVEIDVPRDRDGSFDPQIVRKRRRLSRLDDVVLSLYAEGLTTGEISAHFAEIYGASVSKETVSRITDKVLEEMNDWSNRPLEAVPPRLIRRPSCWDGVLPDAAPAGHYVPSKIESGLINHPTLGIMWVIFVKLIMMRWACRGW